jgi:hypothetical protein
MADWIPSEKDQIDRRECCIHPVALRHSQDHSQLVATAALKQLR